VLLAAPNVRFLQLLWVLLFLLCGCMQSRKPFLPHACCRRNVSCTCRYALDLNGEFSAFDGHLLAEQAAFALACLKQLRAMYSITADTSSCSSQGRAHQPLDLSQLPYNLRPQPLSHASSSSDCSGTAAVVPAVVLAGHSMGGVVARAAATAAWADPELGELAVIVKSCSTGLVILQQTLACWPADWVVLQAASAGIV
jgi:hypothetical protein